MLCNGNVNHCHTTIKADMNMVEHTQNLQLRTNLSSQFLLKNNYKIINETDQQLLLSL